MGKAIDLTGQVFGKLTVIKRVENYVSPKGKQRAQWECLCVCGNKVISTTSNLKSGKNQCWECAHKATGVAKRKDEIIDKEFGYLTVQSIERKLDANGKQRAYCNCICRCGNLVTALMDSLRREGLHSCGCAKKEIANRKAEDYTGRRFGKLTVIEELEDVFPKKVKCLCDCGKPTIVIKAQLPYGRTQSCGCLQREMASNANEKDWTGFKSEYGIELISQAEKNEHGTWLWNCKCHCGAPFVSLPANIVSGKVKSCGCLTMSNGEYMIKTLLEEKRYQFIQQFTFDDCRDIQPLPFDFAIFQNDAIACLIEYDGKQHYEPTEWFGGQSAYIIRQKHDEIKNVFCKKNAIPLIRIPYNYSQEQIKEIITNIK